MVGDGAGCCAKVALGETRKINSSTTVALRLNILTSPLVFRIDLKDGQTLVWIISNDDGNESKISRLRILQITRSGAPGGRPP